MRYRAYLRERYRTILVFTGRIVSLIGLIILTPLLVIPFYPNEFENAWSFLAVGLVLSVGGMALGWRSQPASKASLEVTEAAVIVLFAWIIAIASSAIPLMVADDLNFTQAIFESTSGWTTTGLSVVDVTDTPQIVLLYRSIMQLAGGAGFAVIMVSALSGPVGLGLNIAEGRTDQLAPHIRQSAIMVMRIYAGYVLFGIIALRVVGMNWFDAINHSFAAISTGGFSTRAASIGYWDSAWVESVTIVLMIFGTVNFLTAYTLIRGKYTEFLRNSEIRFMSFLLPIAFILLFLGTAEQRYGDTGRALRVSIFEATSAMSTSGFATVDYQEWLAISEFGWFLLIVLMLIGGGSGSTAGGIKQYRIFVLAQGIVWELRRTFVSEYAVNDATVWQGDRRDFLTDAHIRIVALLVSIYIFALMLLIGILTLHGHGLAASFFEAVSCLSTVGLSVGVTSADAANTQLWAQIVGMFVGRLEFIAVIIGTVKLVEDASYYLSSKGQA